MLFSGCLTKNIGNTSSFNGRLRLRRSVSFDVAARSRTVRKLSFLLMAAAVTTGCTGCSLFENSDTLNEQYWELVYQSRSCTSDEHCVLSSGRGCMSPCGGSAVNPDVVERLLVLEDRFIAAKQKDHLTSCIAVPACRVGIPRAACVEGKCKRVYSE